MKTGPKPRPASERFWAKVAKSEGCWIWTGAKIGRGYGNFSLTPGHTVLAHRWSFVNAGGVIPEGHQIDHLCLVKLCVKPDHLEAVTGAENMRRMGSHVSTCKHGHEYTPENTYTYAGRRSCQECRRVRDRNRSGRVAQSVE